MQRLLREIFFISYIITFTFIYGNLIVLLMNKIKIKTTKEKSLFQNTSLINTNTTIYNTNPNNNNNNQNLKIHYPTMLLLINNDDNDHNILF
jgi:hypothetical protein